MRPMGHTILEVDGRHEQFDDTDLLILTRMLVNSIPYSKDVLWMNIRDDWTRAIDSYFNGFMNLPLQEAADDPQKRERIVTLLKKLESNLAHMGPEIPLSKLKTELRVPRTMFTSPYPTSHVLDAARRVRGLIEP